MIIELQLAVAEISIPGAGSLQVNPGLMADRGNESGVLEDSIWQLSAFLSCL